MPGLTLTFFSLAAAATHAAAAIAFGSYFCGGIDDDPIHDSGYTRSSYNRGTARTQTQPTYIPPPLPPSNTYRPPTTYTQTTPRTPAPPDHSRDVHHPRVVSTDARPPAQTQLSYAHTQPSIAQSASTSSRVPSGVPTEKDRLLSPVIRSVSRSYGVSPCTRTASQTQPSSSRAQPTYTWPSSTLTQSSSNGVQPFTAQSASTSSRVRSCVPVERDPFTPTPSQKQPSSIVTQPSSIRAPLSSPVPVPRPSSTVIKPSCTHAKASSALTQTSTPQIQSSSTLLQASHQNLSLLNTVHTHEPPEYEYSQTRFHVPSREHTGSEPPSRTVIEVITLDLPSEEPASVEGLDLAKKLREHARRRGREMSEARSRAKSAQKNRNHGAAHVHRQEAISHENAMKELDKRAAKIFFGENNKNRKEGMVDLHGLYVAEAIQFAMDQVQAAKSRDDKDVRFIVGKGLHSDAGGAKIRPALEKKFTKQGLKHSLDPKNAGVLIVRLD